MLAASGSNIARRALIAAASPQSVAVGKCMSTAARTPATSLSSRLTRRVVHPRSTRHTKTQFQRLVARASSHSASSSPGAVAPPPPPPALQTHSAVSMTVAGLAAGAAAAYAMADSRADAQASSTYMPSSKVPPTPVSTTLKDPSSGPVTDSDVLVKEPASGIFFPLKLPANPSISAPSQELVATGCKTTWYGLKTLYAVGLYMDVDSARRNLKHHYKDSTTPEMLMSDKNFYTDMINDFKVSSRLVIKMYRHSSAKAMADSLKDKIEPPAKRRYEAVVPILNTMCHAIERSLGSEGAHPGREISFAFFQGGRVYVLLDGALVTEVTDWGVSSSILEAFVGEEAETQDLRQSLARGFWNHVMNEK